MGYENDRLGRIRIVLDRITQPLPANERISWRSRLAPLPPGAAVARLSHPTGASDGGGGGERFPLVGQSERRLRARCAVVVRKGSGRRIARAHGRAAVSTTTARPMDTWRHR